MKKLCTKTLLSILITIFMSCKAQQTYPLNTYPDDVPAGSYLKDFENKLNPYVGVWKATLNNIIIELTITKDNDHVFKRDLSTIFYQDALIVKYIIKNSAGTILQNNIAAQSEADRNFITSISTRNESVYLYYNGTNCKVGWGEIEIKKTDSTHFLWSYRPNDIVLTTKNCPVTQDKTIYLPETENLVFTKQ